MTPEERRALQEKFRELHRRAQRMMATQPESKRKVERALAELRELAGRR
jgi:prophage DNA circulation protein